MYSSQALQLDRAFVFDSRELSERWLRHHKLNEDISITASDHFPVVADFSWTSQTAWRAEASCSESEGP